MNLWLILIGILLVLLAVAIWFGWWVYQERDRYIELNQLKRAEVKTHINEITKLNTVIVDQEAIMTSLMTENRNLLHERQGFTDQYLANQQTIMQDVALIKSRIQFQVKR